MKISDILTTIDKEVPLLIYQTIITGENICIANMGLGLSEFTDNELLRHIQHFAVKKLTAKESTIIVYFQESAFPRLTLPFLNADAIPNNDPNEEKKEDDPWEF